MTTGSKVKKLTQVMLLKVRAQVLEFASRHPDKLPHADLVLRPARPIVAAGPARRDALTIPHFEEGWIHKGEWSSPSYDTEELLPFCYVDVVVGATVLRAKVAYSERRDSYYTWWWRVAP